jgi:hypothetical protein
MLTNFLETGNGSVVISALQPQPIAGQVQSSAIGLQSVMQLVLPRDANGNPVEGSFSGEALIQCIDTTTGDTYFDFLIVILKRFGGVSSYVASVNPITNKGGTLAGATDSITVLPSGDFSFNFDPGTANACVTNGMGIFLINSINP